MPRLRLITFDLDNTLWPVDAVIRRAEQATSQWLQDRHPELAARLDADTLRQQRLALLQRQPEYRHQLTALRRDGLRQALERAGLGPEDVSTLTAQAMEVFLEARQQVTLFPQVERTLEQLAERYRLGAITNGNACLKRIGLAHLFAFQHSAESVGRAKPDPAIFAAALDSGAARAEQTVHVGDHPLDDIAGARSAGFGTVWARMLPQEWPADTPVADGEIREFAALPTVLEQLQHD